MVEKEYLRLGKILPSFNLRQRKALSLWIDALPPDPVRKYTASHILSLLGLSRSTYYAILSNKNYGLTFQKKQEQDVLDAQLIKEVMDYKGFSKGSRQIYMLLPKLKGRKLGLKKTRRLMKKHKITCDIRNKQVQSLARWCNLKEKCKTQLLKPQIPTSHTQQGTTDGCYLFDLWRQEKGLWLRTTRPCDKQSSCFYSC